MAKGLTASKAKKILEDGKVRGKALTEKQKKFFGAVASGATPLKKMNGGWLDKFAMGGSLPGASGMMYARTSGIYPEEPKKAQEGTIQLDEVVVTAPGRKKDTAFRDSDKDGNVVSRFLNVGRGKKREELFKDMPEYLQINDDGDYVLSLDQQQELKNLGITDLDSYNDYFGTNYSRDNALNEFNYLNYYKPQYDDMISSIHGATNQAAKNIMTAASFIPAVRGAGLLSKIPQAYRSVAGPIGQAYRYTANTPVGRAASKYIGKPFSKAMNYKPLGGPFSVGNYADAAALTYSSHNIGPDLKELYNNPSLSAVGNVGLDVLGFTPLLNKKFTTPLRNIGKYYTNPLGSAFKIGSSYNTKVPTWLTRGQNPPNKLLTNPKPDADNFMQSWTNAPGFMERYNAAVLKPSPNPAIFENYIKSATPRYNELATRLKEAEKLLGKRSDKANYLRSELKKLGQEINLSYQPIYPNIARDNLKAIQAGEFNTIYSTSGFSPGSGGTYYWPTAQNPMNTYRYMYPGKPNTMGIGNNSVVKIREVPVGATEAAKTKARTEEMLTGVHETLGHASNTGGAALTKQNRDLIKSALKKNPKVMEGSADWVRKFFDDPNATFKDWRNYLQEPTEVVARVQEIRRQYIPKEFWGTNKQYEVTDKLVDRIFRDGLSGKNKLPTDFFRIVDKKGLKKLMKSIYATIPLAAGANEMTEFKDGGRCWPGYETVAGKTPFSKGSCQKAQEGTIVDIARRYADNKTDGLRPAVGAVDKLRAIFKGEDGCLKDNTCVQVVKEIVNEASIGKENAPYIPADIFNNREFRQNFRDYGFAEVRPEDGGERFREDELRPGDIIQYYYNRDSEGVKEGDGYIGFPYHMGVYDELDQYISDGTQEFPTQRQNMYTTADGKKKDPFYVYRPKEKRNGGWLDKFQEGGVIEDNRGQLAHPGKITKINSNNITMKGVNYPVLGVSDTGDTKMMQPGVENYTYDGSSVTEFPMAQGGEKVEPLYKPAVPGYDQKEFLRQWTNSPMGQSMLLKSFDGNEKALEELTKKRTGNLDMVSINMDKDMEGLGRYTSNNHSILMNPSTSGLNQVGNDYDSVLLHELSHSQDYTPGSQFNKLTIPLSDQKLIRNLSKGSIKNAEDRKTKKENRYLADPTETRARLNVVRDTYQKFRDENMPSVFDSKFTPSMLEEVKGTSQFEELQQIYTDDEILQLLNTVSDNSKSSGPSNMAYAQEGAGVNKEGVKQYKWFKNYMRSPKYKERLKKEFPDYTDEQIGQEVKSRLENVMQTRVGFLPRSSDISTGVDDTQGVYNADEYPGLIMLRPEYSASTSDVLFEPGNYLSGYNTIPLHEWSHAADDGGNRMPQSTTDLMLSKMKENILDIPKDKYYYTRPTEYLGRMQPLRYLMKQEGLYDAGTQDFTKEDLEKAKQNKTIKNNVHFQDLMRNVKSDEDFIELMNKVASVDQKDNSRTMMAKQGRSLVTSDQLTNFTNYNTPQPGGWLDKYN